LKTTAVEDDVRNIIAVDIAIDRDARGQGSKTGTQRDGPLGSRLAARIENGAVEND
jgi:hypothetical protein